MCLSPIDGKMIFRGRKPSWIAHLCCLHVFSTEPLTFAEKIFAADRHKRAKFPKVFSLEIFPCHTVHTCMCTIIIINHNGLPQSSCCQHKALQS